MKKLLPLPAIYLSWKPVNGLELETFLPAFLSLKYTFHDRVEVGLRADVTGNSYAVSDPRIAEAWPCRDARSATSLGPARAARASSCFDHLAYSVVSAGGTVGVRLFSSVWATGFVGHTLYRRFEPLSAGNEAVMGGAEELPNALSVRAALVWRIPRD